MGFHLDVVGQIEAPFGLHHVAEHRQDSAVLLKKCQFDLGFVPFEVLSAHQAVLLRVGLMKNGTASTAPERVMADRVVRQLSAERPYRGDNRSPAAAPT